MFHHVVKVFFIRILAFIWPLHLQYNWLMCRVSRINTHLLDFIKQFQCYSRANSSMWWWIFELSKVSLSHSSGLFMVDASFFIKLGIWLAQFSNHERNTFKNAFRWKMFWYGFESFSDSFKVRVLKHYWLFSTEKIHALNLFSSFSFKKKLWHRSPMHHMD